GKFSFQKDNRRQGFLTYKLADAQTLIIEHTFVKEEFRGDDVGEKLVKSVVDFARNNDLKIIPECPFAAAEFKRNSEYSDILKK
ncbi:MAG: GNAT family N-acetyltransferase, partial [Flavobacteriaceae bacterium]|nr:GNAT family N-acetyltransferase [Flavobacteriaceae bacterium]